MNIKEARKTGQSLNVAVTVGKNGISDATITELVRHLKKDKIVKVRLLPTSNDGDRDQAKAQAQQLAEASNSTVVDIRGHTAVFAR